MCFTCAPLYWALVLPLPLENTGLRVCGQIHLNSPGMQDDIPWCILVSLGAALDLQSSKNQPRESMIWGISMW